MSGPLHGVKVVELGVWVAGPAAAGVLGDWGADVIKIEPLSGDPARTFQRMFGGDMPNNPVFELDNRNKRGIALDISTPEGREIALELLDQADVFVTNVRVDALKRAGLDYDTVSARNPRLVYGQITGYGHAHSRRRGTALSARRYGRSHHGRHICWSNIGRVVSTRTVGYWSNGVVVVVATRCVHDWIRSQHDVGLGSASDDWPTNTNDEPIGQQLSSGRW